MPGKESGQALRSNKLGGGGGGSGVPVHYKQTVSTWVRPCWAGGQGPFPAPDAMAGQCRMTVLNLVLKAPMLLALEAKL